MFERFLYRDVVPRVYQIALSSLPNAQNNPAQKKLYEAFAVGDIESVKSIPRKDRKQLFVTNLSIRYADDLTKAQFGSMDWMQQGMMGWGWGRGSIGSIDPSRGDVRRGDADGRNTTGGWAGPSRTDGGIPGDHRGL